MKRPLDLSHVEVTDVEKAISEAISVYMSVDIFDLIQAVLDRNLNTLSMWITTIGF